MEEAEHYRCRRINLEPRDEPERQAEAACEVLANVDGILLAAPFSAHSIHVIYSLDKVTYELIIELLVELRFDLKDSILLSLRNSIYCYLEENARANMSIDVTEFEIDENADNDAQSRDGEQYWEDYR